MEIKRMQIERMIDLSEYVETKAETNFTQEYPLDPFAGNLSDLIFGKQ
jgi:hypothetical protein